MAVLSGRTVEPGPRRTHPSLVFLEEDTRGPGRAVIGGLGRQSVLVTDSPETRCHEDSKPPERSYPSRSTIRDQQARCQ